MHKKCLAIAWKMTVIKIEGKANYYEKNKRLAMAHDPARECMAEYYFNCLE